jgi:Phosphotransferase enzyme family
VTTPLLPAAADARHLTDVLRRGGVLDKEGFVREVAVESSRPTILSRITRLALVYDRAVAAPRTLILKSDLPNAPSGLWQSGRHEVAFYTDVAAATPVRFAPRCFDADWNDETKAWHLLLEDLGDSHMIATAWPVPPTVAQCERILQAYARFHAAWWDDARLGKSVGIWAAKDETAQNVANARDQFRLFSDQLGDRLSPERRDLYERFFEAAPRLAERYHSHRHLALIHGDSHVWNSFLPRDSSDDVRIFDWDAWRIGTATVDLAYMMALHWSPERRRRLERPLLDHYHAALLAAGVRGYDREALDDDYRRSVLGLIMTPVWQAGANIPPAIWWHHLERILPAVDDLGCRALLEA